MGSLPFIAKEGSLTYYVSDVGLTTHISSYYTFSWSLGEHLPDVVPMIFYHGEVARMSVYRKYVGGRTLRGRRTVYSVIVYACGIYTNNISPNSVIAYFLVRMQGLQVYIETDDALKLVQLSHNIVASMAGDSGKCKCLLNYVYEQIKDKEATDVHEDGRKNGRLGLGYQICFRLRP
ncbi:hypothetical protein ACLB2K_025440 [Fragaria x ananassa]